MHENSKLKQGAWRQQRVAERNRLCKTDYSTEPSNIRTTANLSPVRPRRTTKFDRPDAQSALSLEAYIRPTRVWPEPPTAKNTQVRRHKVPRPTGKVRKSYSRDAMGFVLTGRMTWCECRGSGRAPASKRLLRGPVFSLAGGVRPEVRRERPEPGLGVGALRLHWPTSERIPRAFASPDRSGFNRL